jgi:ribonuclease HII
MSETSVKKKISLIKEELSALPPEEIREAVKAYEEDDRAGVKKLIDQAKKRALAYEKELIRIEGLCRYEKEYSDYDLICGIDEAGRGPLAGPVVAGAVILPKDCRILYINDSKKLTAKKREELYDVINREAVAVGIGMVQQNVIDEINILNATYEAMRKAVSGLSLTPDLLLVDAVRIPGLDTRQVPIIKGDAKSISIGAASIMAKVFRDRMMVQYDEIYPGYGFAKDKGYGSKDHIEALKKLGPCPIHRKSFITNLLANN